MGKWVLIIAVIIVFLPMLFIKSPIIFAFVVLTGIAILKQNFAVIKGAVGEWKVNRMLHKLGQDYSIFHDLYLLKADGGTTQVDHIVTSPYGIFVIETKHFEGWIFGNENNKYWTQVIYKRKEKFLNPIWQNYGHVQALQDYIGPQYDEQIHSIIAFSRTSTLKFKEDFRSASVIQFPQLLRVIKEWDVHRLSNIELQTINQKLDELIIKNKKLKREVEKQHVKQIQNNRKETMRKEKQRIKENICPKCSGSLLLRKGKHGAFYGCSGFPKCRFTKKA